jgi:hypothetical protein
MTFISICEQQEKLHKLKPAVSIFYELTAPLTYFTSEGRSKDLYNIKTIKYLIITVSPWKSFSKHRLSLEEFFEQLEQSEIALRRQTAFDYWLTTIPLHNKVTKEVKFKLTKELVFLNKIEVWPESFKWNVFPMLKKGKNKN